jgi:hypothetical protein
MIQKFLHIRFLQIKRSLQDLSIGHAVALLLIVVFVALIFIIPSFFSLLKNEKSRWIMIGVVAAGILAIHQIRPDKRFISIVSNRPLPIFSGQVRIFASEYLVLALPILGFLFFTKNVLQCIVLILLILCISLITKVLKQNSGIPYFSIYIPHKAFEWRAGMRKSGGFIVLFYLLALIFSWVRIAPVILLFFALTAIAEFFRACEPLSILMLSRDNTIVFLRKKIGQSFLIYSLFTLPIVILSAVLVPDIWYVAPAFFIFACLNITNFILAKYAFYHPNFDTGAGGVMNTLSLFGCVVPFFAPITFFLIFWNYYKAKPKLDYYFFNDEL